MGNCGEAELSGCEIAPAKLPGLFHQRDGGGEGAAGAFSENRHEESNICQRKERPPQVDTRSSFHDYCCQELGLWLSFLTSPGL